MLHNNNQNTNCQLITMNESCADAGAGVVLKRAAEDDLQPPNESKKFAPTVTSDTPNVPDATPPPPTTTTTAAPPTTSTVTVLTNTDGTTVTTTTITTTIDNSKKGREIRLEQNRKAARESRKRKKVMVEELQRSVVFFSRANNTLKQQNDELTRLLLQAQEHTKNLTTHTGATGSHSSSSSSCAPAKTEDVTDPTPTDPVPTIASISKTSEQESLNEQQRNAEIVATQALYESQGFPSAAARAAAQAMNSTGAATLGLEHIASSIRNANGGAMMVSSSTPPPMQPGATMQAMANFQQAAAAAMQAALQGMTGINGISLLQSVLQPPGNMAQHSFTDTMTAIAMQQAAAQHMGQQQQQQQMLQLSTAIAASNAAAAVQQQQHHPQAQSVAVAKVLTAVAPMTSENTTAENPTATVKEEVHTSDL